MHMSAGAFKIGGNRLSAEIDSRASFARRAGDALDRAEGFYLRVLRAVILVIATLLLVYAAWLAISSLYRISRSPDSVVEAQATVSPDELTDAEMPAPSTPTGVTGKPATNSAYQQNYVNFADRYYALYRNNFEPYRQAQDKQLTRAEFDGAFLNTAARLEAVSKGDVNFEDDRADLETLLNVMAEAASKPATIERLRRYKSARKVPVSRHVERSRVSYQVGWDSSSTACPDWYNSPIGCSVRRPVESTYTETVNTMEFPKGTQSHTQIFKAFQDRFFMLLQDRRETNASKAERERQGILAGITYGHLSLYIALQILGGFLILMFFFLLIAIERHQRGVASKSISRTP